MDIVLLIIDSLRAQSLYPDLGLRIPFLRRLEEKAITFRRAYATECWTLPSHASMFTGLLPSEHGAHFHTMGYSGGEPTVAEILSAVGYRTELVTRNPIFEGSLPGITRGFQVVERPMSCKRVWHPTTLQLALSKPRFRRHIRETGFFHPLQRRSQRFLAEFARSILPADELALEHVLGRMSALRRRRTPFFLFSNLFDVHAPYPPSRTSIWRPMRSWDGLVENLLAPGALKKIGRHEYLMPGFRMRQRERRILLGRYHRAIELMDEKLSGFFEGMKDQGLLDDTLLIVASDHGEAFGEHDLYLHDASVYEVNVHVPLWVHHPAISPHVVEDVVSLRDLFGLIERVALRGTVENTMLDPSHRAAKPLAYAQHFHYPHAPRVLPRYRQNLLGVIGKEHKVIARRDGIELYSLADDPEERHPQRVSVEDFGDICAAERISKESILPALRQLRGWGRQALRSGGDGAFRATGLARTPAPPGSGLCEQDGTELA